MLLSPFLRSHVYCGAGGDGQKVFLFLFVWGGEWEGRKKVFCANKCGWPRRGIVRAQEHPHIPRPAAAGGLPAPCFGRYSRSPPSPAAAPAQRSRGRGAAAGRPGPGGVGAGGSRVPPLPPHPFHPVFFPILRIPAASVPVKPYGWRPSGGYLVLKSINFPRKTGCGSIKIKLGGHSRERCAPEVTARLPGQVPASKPRLGGGHIIYSPCASSFIYYY